MRRHLASLSVAWAILVIAIYYRQVWMLIVRGPDEGASISFGFGSSPVAFPFFRDAVLRAARGMLAASIAASAAWVAGTFVVTRLARDARDPLERVALVTSFGIGTLGLMFHALAAAGLYRPAVVTTVLVAIATAGALHLALTHRAIPESWLPTPATALDRLGRGVTILAVALAFFCALTPESEYDALWYHLELPRRWLAAGHPLDDVSEYVSLYPLHWELLLGAALPLGGSVGAKLLHWLMLPACIAVAVLWARRLHAPVWLAAAIFVTAPTVFWESTTAYADLALAVHVGAGAWALCRAWEDRARRWILLAGIAFGFACATKHLGLVALACSLAVFVTGAAWSRRPLGRAVSQAAVVGVLAVALAAPWYAWAAVRSGNPVFPELYGVFGARPPERWSADSEEALGRFKAHFGRPRTLSNQLTLPWDMTMHAAEYGGTYGPLLLALAPAAAVVASRRRQALALAAGTLLYLAVWASPVSSFQARFLVPSWLVASPLAAAAIAHVLPSGRVVNAIWIVVLLLNLPPATMLHEGDREGWNRWLTHVVRDLPAAVVLGGISQDEYLRRQVRSYAAWQWINENLPPDARVLTFSGGDQFYTRRSRVWSDSELARHATWWAGSESEALEGLRDLAITHVLVPQPRIRSAKEEALPLMDMAGRRGALVRLYEDGWYVLYRVEGAAATGTRSTDH